MRLQQFLLLSCIFLFTNCTKKVLVQETKLSFKEDNIAHQVKLNEQYSNKEESPLTDEDFPKFIGHDFFPMNESYKVKAKVVLAKNEKSFEMKTSTERLPVYKKYAELHFEMEGKPQTLTLYQNMSAKSQKMYKDHLFLPFKDLTNGFESYGGGRYIDFLMPLGVLTFIDFNKSYNPYCAYNDKYSCPIPPSENHLDIEIKAGIRLTKSDAH